MRFSSLRMIDVEVMASQTGMMPAPRFHYGPHAADFCDKLFKELSNLPTSLRMSNLFIFELKKQNRFSNQTALTSLVNALRSFARLVKAAFQSVQHKMYKRNLIKIYIELRRFFSSISPLLV